MTNTSIFDTDYETEMEVAYGRENLLSNSINNFIDFVHFSTESIRHQTLSPISGLIYEEMETLVGGIDNETMLSLNPHLGDTVALAEVVDKAKQNGCNITDDLLNKVEGLTEVEALEVAYRIYAFNEMKRILSEHFDRL